MIISNSIIRLAIVWGVFLLPDYCFSQLKMYQFEEIENLQKKDKRNIVVFIHTDWCLYCKAMQNTTFKNEKLMDILMNQFYFIELNAEEKRNILFAGKTFFYQPNGANTGVHQLAEALGTIGGKLSYPTTVILNTENEILYQLKGFMNAKNMVERLR